MTDQPSSSSSAGGASASSSRLNLGTPQSFPVGPAARRQLKRLLVSSTDPSSTVTNFQRTHSLHSFFARSFGTTPSYQLKSERHRQSTRGARAAKSREDDAGVRPEPFRPDSALTFLGHLGVAKAEVHHRVADSLRQALEDEIGRSAAADGGPSRDALLGLLRSSWQYAAVPELRPVLACLVKRLGENTPAQVLERLADRDGKTGGWKHSEILAQFGPAMRRLVYESDWEANVPAGEGSLGGATALSGLIRPAAEEYFRDEKLREAADLPFVSTVRERRIATQNRRTAGGPSAAAAVGAGSAVAGALASIAAAAGSSARKDAGKSSADPGKDRGDGDTKGASSGAAVAKIKEVMGRRPKLLGAVLCMLIAEHGKHATGEAGASGDGDGEVHTVLGGARYLSCTLAADVLLSYGQLPRQYEAVGLLARILDNSVREGIITDDAVAQVQGCLRSIFQSQQGSEKEKDKEKDKQDDVGDATPDKKKKGDAAEPAKKSSKDKDDKKGKKKADSSTAATKKDNTDFQLKLLRKVVSAAVAALRQSDPQGLFLNPVTDEIAPGYSSVIKTPMCLRTMEENGEKLKYRSLPEFEHDVNLMYQNCITYNIGKEGQWFRGEARRQGKVWTKDIMPQARALFKREMNKRKKALERAEQQKKEKAAASAGQETSEDKKKPSSAMGSGSAGDKKRKRDDADSSNKDQSAARAEKIQKVLAGSGLGKTDDDAIRRLTAKDLEPLPPSKSKRRKKDADLPSMPALAAMLLSDPFVVRLIAERVLRSLRADVLGEKTVPVNHRAVPSLMQLLHVVQFSTQLCAIRGKRFFIPDVGLAGVGAGGNEEGGDQAPGAGVPFASLRKYAPLLAGLLLESDLDRRMAAGGDLHDAASSNAVSALPETDPSRWEAGDMPESSLLETVPRALVGGALVHLIQPGNSNDAALKRQFPRFMTALTALSGTDLASERPFFLCLIRALLRHKSKLSHGTRDAVSEAWVGWIKGVRGGRERSTLASPVHECFLTLLNEWAALGNVLLPRDAMLKLAEDAARAAEASGGEGGGTFAARWAAKDDEAFAPVKARYVKMLEGVPEARAAQWRERVGIDDASLATLVDGARAEVAEGTAEGGGVAVEM